MQAHPQLVDLLTKSKKILIFTGAGISTGSGIPDFRGPNGLWKKRQPVYYQDFMASESARFEHWDYKAEAWAAFRDAKPNAVHQAIAQLEAAEKLLMCVTQNIDGLHEKAGTSRERLVEIHGTNRYIECQCCGEITDPEPHFQQFNATQTPPICTCGGFLKPATISFGQSLRESDLVRASESAAQTDLVISLGSTLSVQPAASIPLIAAERGVPYVVINQGDTDHDRHPALNLRLDGDVGELFPPAVVSGLNAS